jgi:hypothetical protein
VNAGGQGQASGGKPHLAIKQGLKTPQLRSSKHAKHPSLLKDDMVLHPSIHSLLLMSEQQVFLMVAQVEGQSTFTPSSSSPQAPRLSTIKTANRAMLLLMGTSLQLNPGYGELIFPIIYTIIY